MAGGSAQKDPPPIYAPRPPEWLPKAHRSADLGYTGYYPPYPGQAEDVISDNTVKQGLTIPHAISAEMFSAQELVRERITQNDALAGIEDLINQVFSRKAVKVPPVPPSTFRLPSRVTVNEPKRQAWFADLANPSVPLSRLGKSVPHGAKGHDLLDLLHNNGVTISRAVWFLRVFGGNETAGIRNNPKANYNPTQYSVDWANIVTTYLKKQLTDIALPTAPRPGLTFKTTFKPVLAEAESRDRWISRFSYSLGLLRSFYADGMVDHWTFLSWMVLQLSISNLAQAGFVVRLADEYLPGVLKSRALVRAFVDACLSKRVELNSTPGREHLSYLEDLLENLLQRTFLGSPDAFISPRTWLLHEDMLLQILQKVPPNASEDAQNGGGIVQAAVMQLQSTLYEVRKRNDALLFRNRPKSVMTRLRSAVQDVQILNSLSATTDLHKITFLSTQSSDSADLFAKKLDLLLTWSVTPLQYGDHRIYACVSLLRLWRAKAGERASRRQHERSPSPGPDEVLHDALFEWLNTSDVARLEANLGVVAQLFGELVQWELFSFSSYVTRLIARGEAGLSFTQEGEPSKHLNFLRWIPLHESTRALMNQRKVALYGVRARETPEDNNERQMRKEIRALLPELFGGMQEPDPPRCSASLKTGCETLFSSPRYEQVRTLRHWLYPALKTYLSNHASQGTTSNSLLRTYTTAVLVMEHIQCYGCILDISLVMLSHASTNDLLTAVTETFRRHINVWSSMDALGRITTALYSSHQAWKARSLPRRSLLTLLEDMDAPRHLQEGASEQLKADMVSFQQTLCPALDQPTVVPDVMPEILLLAEDINPDAPSILASNLWYKYRGSPDWAWKVWDNTIASLRQVPVLMINSDARRACASRYSAFLLSIDQHLPGGFDDQVLQWFLGPGKNELAALTAEAWDVVNFVLLRLAVNGALTVTTILRGVMYTAWQSGASVITLEEGVALEVMMKAVNDLCTHLLLRMDGNEDGTPPMDLLEVQRMRTHRQAVYREPHISLLINNIPTLVFLENNVHLPDELRARARSLRLAICQRNRFRQGVYRNLDNVRAAFEEPLGSDAVATELRGPLVAALRIILDDSSDSDSDTSTSLSAWRSVSSLLSPWKLAATGIDLQFVLKQAGEGLSQESRRESANAELDAFTNTFFDHSMTSEEADFIAEVGRRAGSAVASKFVNNGLRHMSEMLTFKSPNFEIDMALSNVARAGELLRLLAHLVEPSRHDVSQLPRVDQSVQDGFIECAAQTLQLLVNALRNSPPLSSDTSRESDLTKIVVFLLRLLQFDLGFKNIWTDQTKARSEDLSRFLIDLLFRYGGSEFLDPVAFSVTLDTLYYLIDEVSTGPKTTSVDLLKGYPAIERHVIPTQMPTPYRAQLLALCPYDKTSPTVADLRHGARDESGQIVQGEPVQNRPWEWSEYLGDPELKPEEKEKEEREREALGARHMIKNNTSIALELFSATPTGEGIIEDVDVPNARNARSGVLNQSQRTLGEMRETEDGLVAESVFLRDWKDTRIEVPQQSTRGASETGGLRDVQPQAQEEATSHRKGGTPRSGGGASPSQSKSASSRLGTPLQQQVLGGQGRLSGSTIAEAIDVDSLPESSAGDAASATRGHKRKATTDSIESAVGTVPAAGPSRTGGKKTKAGKAPAKTTAKKTKKK